MREVVYRVPTIPNPDPPARSTTVSAPRKRGGGASLFRDINALDPMALTTLAVLIAADDMEN